MPRQPAPQQTPSTVNTVDRADPAPGSNRRQPKPQPSREREVGAGNAKHTPASPYTAGKQ